MTQDASDIVVATAERKPWTTPMVIVGETQDTEAKGYAAGDYTIAGGAPYGS